jgi:hypothetical protein
VSVLSRFRSQLCKLVAIEVVTSAPFMPKTDNSSAVERLSGSRVFAVWQTSSKICSGSWAKKMGRAPPLWMMACLNGTRSPQVFLLYRR